VNRRDLVLFTTVAALLAAGFVATRRDPQPRSQPDPDATRSPAPVVTASLPVDRAPAPGHEGRLPSLATALPREIAIDPQTAVPLSTNPVGRALALFETGFDTRSAKNRLTVYVLGDDGRLRWLDVATLAPTLDGNNNLISPFSTTVLKPDGTRAAFPQWDRVVVVDLTTAAARWIELAGHNERVFWLGEQLLVGQDLGTVQLDPLSGRVTRRPYASSGLIAGRPQGAPVLDLVYDRRTWILRTWADSSQTAAVPVAALPGGADARQAGWAYGWQVALDFRYTGAQPVPEFTDRSESVVVFDSNTGTGVSRLMLTSDEPVRRAGCCAVLGWLNQRLVLVDVPGRDRWLLAWEPATGNVYRISRITFPGTRLTLSVVDGAYL
jgi:hypothetical protein